MINGESVINAIKQIYPEIQGGFVYWSLKHDGSELNHAEDGLIWENKKYPKPSWNEIMQIINSTYQQNV